MKANQLIIGTELKGRTSKAVVKIEDYQPAFQAEPQQWLLRGAWFNLSQIDARYTLHKPTGKEPKNKKAKIVASAS